MTTTQAATPSSIRVVDPFEVPDWDERVSQLPGATFFHTASWARVLAKTYEFKPFYFVAEKNDRLVGLLPLFEVDSWLTGKRAISLPFADACAPLCHDKTLLAKLLDSARKQGQANHWKYIELRGGLELLPGAIPSTSFASHKLQLSPDIHSLHKQYADSVQRAIRKAQKSSLTVEFSSDEESLKSFHHLLCLTRKRHGTPPQPLRFFEQIHQHVINPGKGWVVLARHQGIPIAGAIFLHFGHHVFYKFGASDQEHQHLRGNNLVMAHAIEWYAQNGFTSFDFGRTSLHNEGLRHFKLGWGATEHQIDYVRINPRTGEYQTAPDQPPGLPQRLLKHLPVSIARLIGSLLYRHAA